MVLGVLSLELLLVLLVELVLGGKICRVQASKEGQSTLVEREGVEPRA